MALYKLLWKGLYDTSLDEKVQDMSQILAMATRPPDDLVPITSDLTAYSLHCSDTGPSDASQAYVSGKLLPQDLCTCCPPTGNALPQIFSWLTLSPPSSLRSDVSSSVRAGLISFKKFQLTPQPPSTSPILLYFLPECSSPI